MSNQMYIVIWNAYGEWHATKPFETEKEAKRHIELYLARPEKDYIKRITIIPIDMDKVAAE